MTSTLFNLECPTEKLYLSLHFFLMTFCCDVLEKHNCFTAWSVNSFTVSSLCEEEAEEADPQQSILLQSVNVWIVPGVSCHTSTFMTVNETILLQIVNMSEYNSQL